MHGRRQFGAIIDSAASDLQWRRSLVGQVIGPLTGSGFHFLITTSQLLHQGGWPPLSASLAAPSPIMACLDSLRSGRFRLTFSSVHPCLPCRHSPHSSFCSPGVRPGLVGPQAPCRERGMLPRPRTYSLYSTAYSQSQAWDVEAQHAGGAMSWQGLEEAGNNSNERTSPSGADLLSLNSPRCSVAFLSLRG